jgi:hypothetical protein
MEMNRMERKPETDGQGNEQETRKPYHKPEVIVYGNIREITRNAGSKGNLDGGGGAAAGPKTGT